jgi:hypothetical protein
VESNALVTVRSSNIRNHFKFGVRRDAGTPVDCTENYWGHASGPKDSSDDRPSGDFNPDGKGDAVTDRVRYRQFAAEAYSIP